MVKSLCTRMNIYWTLVEHLLVRSPLFRLVCSLSALFNDNDLLKVPTVAACICSFSPFNFGDNWHYCEGIRTKTQVGYQKNKLIHHTHHFFHGFILSLDFSHLFFAQRLRHSLCTQPEAPPPRPRHPQPRGPARLRFVSMR